MISTPICKEFTASWSNGKYMLIALSLVFGSGILCGQSRDYYPPTVFPDRVMLNLTDDPASSIAITWRTAVYIDSGVVQIALADPSPDLLQNARAYGASRSEYVSNLNVSNYFSAVIEDLEPGTMYAYRVGYARYWSEWAHFTTAEEGAEPLSFIYFGDAQNDIKSMWSRAIRGAFQQMPKADFLLHAGDLVNRPNNDREWGEWYQAGGWIYQMIPSIATPGNHEYWRDRRGNTRLSTLWRPTFTLPENGPAGYEETTYYVDYHGVRIISIDSPAYLRSSQDSAAQVKWLEKVLASNRNRWSIVTMHYPIYSTKFGRDNAGLRNGVQPLLEEYDVDLVLQGHDHTYGRGTNLPVGDGRNVSLAGPIYVVSVSGPKMYDLGLDEWMYRGASNTQLYQLITVDGDSLRFEAYTVDNQLYDAFELRKDQNGERSFFDLAPDTPERLELPPRFQRLMGKEELSQYESRFQRYKARKAAQKGN